MRTAPKDKAEHHILPDRRARGLLDQAIPLIEWAKHTYAKWRIGILGTGPTMPRRDSETAADALFIDAPTELARRDMLRVIVSGRLNFARNP
jgi:hypothetical protein